jgi:hypothetical protein
VKPADPISGRGLIEAASAGLLGKIPWDLQILLRAEKCKLQGDFPHFFEYRDPIPPIGYNLPTY